MTLFFAVLPALGGGHNAKKSEKASSTIEVEERKTDLLKGKLQKLLLVFMKITIITRLI